MRLPFSSTIRTEQYHQRDELTTFTILDVRGIKV